MSNGNTHLRDRYQSHPILSMRQRRPREGKRLAQNHSGNSGAEFKPREPDPVTGRGAEWSHDILTCKAGVGRGGWGQCCCRNLPPGFGD